MDLLNYHSCAYPATPRFAALFSPAYHVQTVPLHSAAILNHQPLPPNLKSIIWNQSTKFMVIFKTQ